MDFTFLRATGEVAFFRSDAEEAEWTEEEMSLLCTFPVDKGKMIERGMTVLFQDPATGDWQAYEIRNCSMFPGESYQQFTAECIAISELTDCHISDDIELSDVDAAYALSTILPGTGWNIGSNVASGTSLADIGRGSVWEGIITIQNNWNVYIMPRVTVNASGIVGRYLDILPSEGVWRGLRLAIDKNCSDPCVTYDDSELYTALYGYGATYIEGDDPETQETIETTFADIEWGATGDHPAKPAGQKYLEWAEKTALYGRNGKPRFWYFQNTAIKDPNVLLEKTWATLKTCSDPKVSVTGTVTDLKRLGYADQPLRLHDMAIVDIYPLGVQLYRQVIKLTVNLLDPTKNTPTIGDYIPNIIYINRETEDFATGGSVGVATREASGSGGGGGGGRTRSAKKQGEFETEISQNERNIKLEARQVDQNRKVLRAAGMQIDPITGVIIYAEDVENGIGANFRVTNNKIEGEVTARKAGEQVLSSRITQTESSIQLEVQNRISSDTILSSRITQTATEIRSEVSNTAAGLSSRITQNANSISAEVTRATGAESSLSGRIDVTESDISAEVTNRSNADEALSGRITVNASSITAEVTRATSAETSLSGSITVNANKVAIVVDDNNNIKTASIVAGINGQEGSYVKIDADTINLSGYVTVSELNATNATINSLRSGSAAFTLVNAQGIRLSGYSFYLGTVTISGTQYNVVRWGAGD